jgi:hypothetical protein
VSARHRTQKMRPTFGARDIIPGISATATACPAVQSKIKSRSSLSRRIALKVECLETLEGLVEFKSSEQQSDDPVSLMALAISPKRNAGAWFKARGSTAIIVHWTDGRATPAAKQDNADAILLLKIFKEVPKGPNPNTFLGRCQIERTYFPFLRNRGTMGLHVEFALHNEFGDQGHVRGATP